MTASAFACALAAFSSPASGTPTSKLTYLRGSGAERCPDESELRKAVAARLGYDPFFPYASRTVVAEIARAQRRFHSSVKIVDDHGVVRGERTLTSASDDCGEVLTALALAISIAVDDFEVDVAPPPAPPPAVAAVETRPETQEAPPAVGRFEATAERGAAPPPVSGRAPLARTFHVWLTPIASFGAAPATSFGLQGSFEVRFRRIVSVGVEARGDLPASAATLRGPRVSTSLLLGSVVGCLRAPSPVFFCGIGSVGRFQESGSNLGGAASGSALFAAVGGRAGLALPLGERFFFLAHADALAALTRHAVQIDGQDVFVISPVVGSVGFGGGATF